MTCVLAFASLAFGAFSLTVAQAYTSAVRYLTLGALPVVVLAFALSPGSAGSAGTVACTEAALHGSFAAVPNSAGLGHISYRLELRNRTGSACAFPTHPTLRLEDAHKHGLPTHPEFAAAHNPTLMIGAHRALLTSARFSPDIPSGGEGHVCERIAHWLRVGLLAHARITVPVEPPTRVCGHGYMLFGALHQGS